MRNKFNYGELVKINGEGKQLGRVENQLGFIVEKDEFYNDYYIELLFGENDWFDEEALERIFDEKRNKTEKYQVRLCTSTKGYEILKNNIYKNEPISNNKFKKIDIYKKIKQNGKVYIILGWNSVFWPTSNKSVKIIEDTMKNFKMLNIPFQYILLNEDVISDIRIMEFSTDKDDANIFLIERKIKIKKLNNRKDKNDNTKNFKCDDQNRSSNER